MSDRKSSRRDLLAALLAGGTCVAFPGARVLFADEAPETPAVPEVPVARDFLLPMKVWRNPGWRFGVPWTHARCPTCRKHYKHVGTDVNHGRGYARYRVYATEAGIVRLTLYSKRWAWCVVIEHTCKDGKKITSVYWHLAKPIVKTGQVVKRRQQIGILADLGKGTHLHFGIRRAPYHRTLSCKGALPGCGHPKTGLPRHPERFTDPVAWVRVH